MIRLDINIFILFTLLKNTLVPCSYSRSML